MKTKMMMGAGLAGVLAMAGAARADVSNYDDLAEGAVGTSMSYHGVNYRDVNNVDGVFPDGSTFTAADLGNLLIVEDATFFYPGFPGWGSSPNSLTFGSAYVPGPNLSIGALATAWMDLDTPANSASLDLAFYEDGPWGGIVYHLDALKAGVVVDSDTYTLSDLGGRDHVSVKNLGVSGSGFDSLHLYATFGSDFSAPRGMIDNLTITSVPGPASVGLLGLAGLGLRRRR